MTSRRPTRRTGKCAFHASAQSASWTIRVVSSPIGRRPNAWRWPSASDGLGGGRRSAAPGRGPGGRPGRSPAGSGRPGRRGPRRPARTPARRSSRPARPGRGSRRRPRRPRCRPRPRARARRRAIGATPASPLSQARREPCRGSRRRSARPTRRPRRRTRSSSSRWRFESFAGTTTLTNTWRSPRDPARRRWGTPRPRSRISVPGWVPGLTSTSSSPSTVGTAIVVPRAAWTIETSAS